MASLRLGDSGMRKSMLCQLRHKKYQDVWNTTCKLTDAGKEISRASKFHKVIICSKTTVIPLSKYSFTSFFTAIFDDTSLSSSVKNLITFVVPFSQFCLVISTGKF
jgi:hypothetical protein